MSKPLLQLAYADVGPLPARRRDINIGLLLLTLTGLYFVLAVGGIMQGQQGQLAFDWLAHVGVVISNVSSGAAEQYAQWAITFFGLTAGGQFILQYATQSAGLRRMFGLVGMVLAAAALVLIILAIAAIFEKPDTLGALPTVIPGCFITWVVGIECGRFVVPDFHRQRELLEAHLADLERKLHRLPRAAASTAGAYRALLGWSALVGLVTAAAVLPAGLVPVGATFGVTTLLTGVNLFVLSQMTAATLVQPSASKRFWTRAFWYLVFAVIAVFTVASVLPLSPGAEIPLSAALVGDLMLPIAFLRLPGSAPAWLLNRSLGGVLARVERNDLERMRTAALKRRDELDLHAGRSSRPVLLEKLLRGVRRRT